MRLRYGMLPIAAAFLAGPTWGQQNQLASCPTGSCTIWGGFEDNIGTGSSDYDYNDLVFSLTGPGLTLGTFGAQTGGLFAPPATGTLVLGAGTGSPGASPFWNNPSQDGSKNNVGWCIYGGGACNGGAGLAPNDDYAAAVGPPSGGSLNNVDFVENSGGGVSGTITLEITANHSDELIEYCDESDTSITTPFGSCHSLGLNLLTSSPLATATFNPVGEFLIEASNGTDTFSSVMGFGDATTPAPDPNVSHFAFFVDPVPEPGSIVLFGTVLAFGLGSIKWKRRKA